jgi:prefoldin subunit 5
MRAVEQERDRLARQVTALEEKLAEMDRELERIRKTIKP